MCLLAGYVSPSALGFEWGIPLHQRRIRIEYSEFLSFGMIPSLKSIRDSPVQSLKSNGTVLCVRVPKFVVLTSGDARDPDDDFCLLTRSGTRTRFELSFLAKDTCRPTPSPNPASPRPTERLAESFSVKWKFSLFWLPEVLKFGFSYEGLFVLRQYRSNFI